MKDTKQEAPVSAGVWVKASERLPEDLQEVLGVHIEAGGIEKVYYSYEQKRWYECNANNNYEILISHWMPLPIFDSESTSVQGEGLRRALLRKVTEDVECFESIKLTEFGQGGYQYAKDVLRIIEKAYREGMIEGGTTLTTDEAWKQFSEANNLNPSSPSGQDAGQETK